MEAVFAVYYSTTTVHGAEAQPIDTLLSTLPVQPARLLLHRAKALPTEARVSSTSPRTPQQRVFQQRRFEGYGPGASNGQRRCQPVGAFLSAMWHRKTPPTMRSLPHSVLLLQRTSATTLASAQARLQALARSDSTVPTTDPADPACPVLLGRSRRPGHRGRRGQHVVRSQRPREPSVVERYAILVGFGPVSGILLRRGRYNQTPDLQLGSADV